MARPRNIILLNETYRALAGQFYEYLLRLGYHPKTSRSRYHYACEFLHWLEQRGELDITGIDGPTINGDTISLDENGNYHLEGKNADSFIKLLQSQFDTLITNKIDENKNEKEKE